jgi:hypothetical protein
MEKNVMRSMELVGRERMEVAVSSFIHNYENKILTKAATTLSVGRRLRR